MQGFLGICSAGGKKGKQGSPFPPVGPFEASEVRLYGDHAIAVHLQNAEDMLICLVAEPRKQEVNIKVQGHQGKKERSSTTSGTEQRAR